MKREHLTIAGLPAVRDKALLYEAPIEWTLTIAETARRIIMKRNPYKRSARGEIKGISIGLE